MSVEGSAAIRAARPAEAALLSGLAFRSKAYWRYSDEFMEACREEIAISADEVREQPTFVAERDGAIRGFYTLEHLSDDAVELGGLFVEPSDIGTGLGRALLRHARAEASRRGYRTLVIQSDPNATRFYESSGAVLVGTKPSASIAGRVLPVLELTLMSRAAADGDATE
jgi:GNAT superfamily N-acetyltransferase